MLLVFAHPDAYQQIKSLQEENQNLLEQVATLQKENSVLKIPKPLPTPPCLRSRSDLLRTWPMQKWVNCLKEDLVQLPRLWQEILPQLHESKNCNERVLFDLCKSPNATASAVLSHSEQCVQNLFKKYPAVFKVGITSNPIRRWCHPLYGYGLDKKECWIGNESNCCLSFILQCSFG